MISFETAILGDVVYPYQVWVYHVLIIQILKAYRRSCKITLPESLTIKFSFISRNIYVRGIEMMEISGVSVRTYYGAKSVDDAIKYPKKIGLSMSYENIQKLFDKKES